MRWGLLVVAIVLAGCSTPAPAPVATGDPPAPEPTQGALEGVPDWRPDVAPPARREAVDAAVTLSETWVKPRRLVAANVSAPEGSTVSWFVGAPGGDPFASWVEGAWYLGGGAKADPESSHHRPPQHLRVEDAAIAPGDSSRPFELSAGRYVVTEPSGARVTIVVRPSAPAAPIVHVVVLDDPARRFSPDEVDIHPSTRVRFWNSAQEPTELTEASYLAPLGEGPREVDVVGVDPGPYDVVAVVRAGEAGRAEPAARVLVDFESPPPGFACGPWSDRLSDLDAPTARREARHLMAATFPLRSVALDLDVSPITDARLRVSLVLDGTTYATADFTESGALVTGPLPAGDWIVLVEAEKGVASYVLSGAARYLVDAPE